jgi:hypothetical protein
LTGSPAAPALVEDNPSAVAAIAAPTPSATNQRTLGRRATRALRAGAATWRPGIDTPVLGGWTRINRASQTPEA